MLEAHHLSVSIQCPPADVYRFASNVENLSQWATGLGKPVRKAGRDWVIEGPLGELKVRFAEPNAYGVLDHDVTLPTGDTVHNPLRVLPNTAGSEVVFTLFRQPGTSNHDFQADALAVARDLQTLKDVLERR